MVVEHIRRAVAIAVADGNCPMTSDVTGFVPDAVWDKLHLEGHIRYDVDRARAVATPAGLNWLKQVLHAA